MLAWGVGPTLMLHSHQAKAKANVTSLMSLSVNSYIENNATHLLAMSLSRSHSLGVNEP